MYGALYERKLQYSDMESYTLPVDMAMPVDVSDIP